MADKGFGVRLFFSQGQGFTPRELASVGFFSLALGDLDADGDVDLASGYDTVDVRLNDGRGNFGPEKLAPVTGLGGLLASGDLDGDGLLDLVGDGYTGQFYVLMGEGGGAFSPALAASVDGSGGVTLADVDGDGRLDLLRAGDFGRSSVVLLPGLGDGTFGAPRYLGADGRPVVLDVDEDGTKDLVTFGGQILLGQGDGTFGDGGTAPAGGIRLAEDFDGDGHLDLVAADEEGLSVLAGDGKGGFALLAVAAGPASTVASGDFDGDGLLDLAVTDWNVWSSPDLAAVTVLMARCP